MAKKLDYGQIADDVIRLVGGQENVQTMSHCMTRLRFVLKDEGKADAEAIKKIGGVLGVVSAGGQFMVILGQNLLPVYDAVQKKYTITAGENTTENLDEKKKEPLTVKGVLTALLGYVMASVTPMIPPVVAGGMLKVVMVLISLAVDGFDKTSTYTIISGIADASFYFMPIFVAYGAATKLGATPGYAMMAVAALLHGNWTSIVAAGNPVTLIGIPVRLVSYSSSLLPALLLAPCAYHLEKLFNKIVPGIFKSLLVGLCTVTCTGILGFLFLAPLGNFIGGYIAGFFMVLGDHVAPLAIALLAACLPWLIMAGMHTAISPFMIALLADPGYDAILRPAFLLHNMCEGGACLGVALRAKNPELRSQALGLAFGCIVAGVTEPAIYGINLPRKKPMIGVMIGGAVGGIVAGLLGVRVYIMGYSTILALPIFQETWLKMLIAIVVGILTACISTFIMCPEVSKEGMEEEGAKEEKAAIAKA